MTLVRVTIEVEGGGHDFTIQREDNLLTGGVLASDRVRSLVRDAQASMVAALTAVPSPVL